MNPVLKKQWNQPILGKSGICVFGEGNRKRKIRKKSK